MENELIIGRNAVLEALRAKREMNKIWISENAHGSQMKELIDLAKRSGALVQFVPKKRLDALAATANHQGVVASVAAYEYKTIDDLFHIAESRNEPPFFLLLDGIEDPHNLGSILRTADCTGVHGVIIPRRRSVGLTAAVAKASTGAIEYVPVVRVNNLAQTMEQLKERGIWFIGTDAKGEQDFREAEYTLPICIVIGSEGKGISRLVKEKCDFLVKLPMRGKVTSLNASVAAALCMYEAMRKRYPLKGG